MISELKNGIIHVIREKYPEQCKSFTENFREKMKIFENLKGKYLMKMIFLYKCPNQWKISWNDSKLCVSFSFKKEISLICAEIATSDYWKDGYCVLCFKYQFLLTFTTEISRNISFRLCCLANSSVTYTGHSRCSFFLVNKFHDYK